MEQESAEVKMCKELAAGQEDRELQAGGGLDSDDKTREHIVRVLQLEMEKQEQPVTLSEIKEHYTADRELATVIRWLETDSAPEKVNYRKDSTELCHYRRNLDRMFYIDGVLYRKWIEVQNREEDRSLVVVPVGGSKRSTIRDRCQDNAMLNMILFSFFSSDII